MSAAEKESRIGEQDIEVTTAENGDTFIRTKRPDEGSVPEGQLLLLCEEDVEQLRDILNQEADDE